MIWIIGLGLITNILSAGITVQPESMRTEISIRVGETKYIQVPPYFQFETVYRKQIKRIDEQGNEVAIDNICKEYPADIVFNSTFRHVINMTAAPDNQDVITTFEEIKADRKILDTTIINNTIYLLLRQNIILVFNTSTHQEPDIVMIPTQSLEDIQVGFFVQINNSKLLVITPNEVFVVNGKDMLQIQGFENFTNLESARQLFGTYFAVCGVKEGVIIYNFTDTKIVKVKTMDSTFFERDSIFISDMAYNSQKNEIFVSDEKYGIHIIEIKLKNNDILVSLKNAGYRKVGCSVILFSEGNLYASCEDLFKVRYSTDNQIITLPHPMFKIKQLLVYKGLLVAVGQDLLMKYYNDKLTDQGPLLDITQRLIFYENNKYLVANFYQIQTGTFRIQYPSIQCSTFNQSIQTSIPAIIKTEAQCSLLYFTKYQVPIPPTTTNTSTCIYTSPIILNFWISQQFNIEIIFIAMGILFLVAGIITTWAIFISNKQIVLKRTLQTYSVPTMQIPQKANNIDYNHFVEEPSDHSNGISETADNLQNN